MGRPLSRSYGAILPSSLTRVVSIALGFSPRPPVSVWGTGTYALPRGFSWQHGISHFASKWARHHTSEYVPGGFAYPTSRVLVRGRPTPRLAYPSASPHR